MKLLMWVDEWDSDMVQLGYAAKSPRGKVNVICGGQMHIDSVAECFGGEVKEALKSEAALRQASNREESRFLLSFIAEGDDFEVLDSAPDFF